MRLTSTNIYSGILCLCMSLCQPLHAQLFINEFMASNSTVIMDEYGEYDDWIEIYNAGTSPVDLAGYFISDDNNLPTKWQISNSNPLKTTVPAGGYLLLWADLATFQGANHLNFKLSELGEHILLHEPNGSVLVDKVKFKEQISNISIGRSEDGAEDFLPFNIPTPGVTNGAVCIPLPDRVLFNEINYKSNILYNAGDWVELYNPSNNFVDLSSWTFHDTDTFFTLPNGTLIGPKGYLVLAENTNFFSSMFPDVVNYVGNSGIALGGNGEQIRLFSESGCLVEEITYDDDFPWTEEADGLGATTALIDPTRDNKLAGSWVSSNVGGAPHGTPGAPNGIADPCITIPPRIVINEINYNSNPAMDPSNWVEVYNPMPSIVDLSGWELHDADSAFVFPQGTTIQPDGYLVVVENPILFASVFPDVPNFMGYLGFSLNNGGENLLLYTQDRCIVDSVDYDDSAPWPIEPDGVGPTLSLFDQEMNNADGSNWSTSTGFGTPGEKNKFSCLQATAELSSYDSTVELVIECRKGNWSYYFHEDNLSELLFAIEQKPQVAGGNTNDIELKVSLTTTLYPNASDNFVNGIFKKENILAQEAIFAMGRYWNIEYMPGSPELNGKVNIRFYFGLDEISAINDAASIWNKDNANNTLNLGQPIWFKTVRDSYDPITDLSPKNVENSITLTPFILSIEDNVFYVQFNDIASFSGGSAVVRVSKGDPVLPVDLVSFEGNSNECTLQLAWETATEVNLSHFEVERSADGKNFFTYGRQDGLGSTVTGYEYSYTVSDNIQPLNYFRLKIVDFDGSFDYSDIIPVKSDCYQEGQILVSNIFPNPTTEQASIQMIVPFADDDVVVQIVDITGKLIQATPQRLDEGINLLTVDILNLAPSIYFVQIVGTDWKAAPQKLVKIDK